MSDKKQGPVRNHQFDLLRILFATSVLLAHAFELTDGNRQRELLCRLLAHSNVTLGVLGVDGFFLLSGYLIVKSWLRDPSATDFSVKRFLRIAPGYAVAMAVSVVVVGMVAPGTDHFFRQLDWSSAKSLIFVFQPEPFNVFPSNHYKALNASLWTILYEFRCYCIVMVFGLLGLLGRRSLWLTVTAVLITLMSAPVLLNHLPWPSLFYTILGDPSSFTRLSAVFFVGGCFLLFKPDIQFKPMGAALAALGLVAVRFIRPSLIETALVIFGGYLMFYFASKPLRSLHWMGHVPDVSYGMYLYGWPIESLLISQLHPSPWVTFAVATLVCLFMGWVSWSAVESPALSLRKRFRITFSLNNQRRAYS